MNDVVFNGALCFIVNCFAFYVIYDYLFRGDS